MFIDRDGLIGSPHSGSRMDLDSLDRLVLAAARAPLAHAGPDFRQIIEQADAGICIVQDGLLQYANPKFAQLHGWRMQDLPDTQFVQLVHPDERAELARIGCPRDAGEPGAAFRSRHLRRNGSSFETRISARSIEYRGRQASLLTVSDDADLAEAQARIEHLLNYHPVTGLATRPRLFARAAAAIEIARRELQPLALLLLRVPDLDRVHHALGLSAGEALATTLAGRLVRGCREADTVAHLGGGEFAILADPAAGADVRHALNLATRLLAAIRAPATVDATELVSDGCIGISLFPDDAGTAAELLEHAHIACAHGAGGIRFYTHEATRNAARRIRIEAGLRHALERKELSLHYQPQVELRGGRIIGVEALLRWQSPEFGAVPPAEFVPIAEEVGLIVAIGEWVFRSACEQSVDWARAGLPALRIGVNLSPRQLEQPDISQRLQSILRDTGADPASIGVEVTESVLMHDLEHARRTLEELSAIGIEISLDDFGTGYSNLGALHALPFDVLKIDRSLVHDVTAAPEHVSITRAVLMLAQELKIKVLAEGVETGGQLALLAAHGCDVIQGYVFSRPVPAEAMARMLRDGRCLPGHFRHRTARKRTLLLVDGEEHTLSSLRHLLGQDAYHIVVARNGDEGLARLAGHDVDVIISDQRLPGMSGVEFLRRAKQRHPLAVRIMLSGYAELASIADAVNQGAVYRFLTKPWDDARLRADIAEAFRHKEISADQSAAGGNARARAPHPRPCEHTIP